MNDAQNSFSVEKISKLACLQLDEREQSRIQTQLAEVLAFVDQFDSLDLNDVEPYFGHGDREALVRSDIEQAGLERDEVLKNAPQQDGEFFLVPPVFG